MRHRTHADFRTTIYAKFVPIPVGVSGPTHSVPLPAACPESARADQELYVDVRRETPDVMFVVVRHLPTHDLRPP
ncbi:hypothetical protein FM103_11720 [Corynebacterium xerosis]|nr:hypothetical protein FM103_11720 [Corynebacterium xerosis]